MSFKQTSSFIACGFFILVSSQACYAQEAAVVNADNTATNSRDRLAQEPTADQATNSKSDRDIMQQIRKAIVADSSLSTNAHNVKIIARQGKVTLKGPVNNSAERDAVETRAVQVAGQQNVTDELSVASDSSTH